MVPENVSSQFAADACSFVHGARSKARRLSRRATPDATRHRRRICKSRYRVRLDIWTSLRGHSRVVRGCAIHALRYSVWMPCQQVNSSRDAGHQSRHEAASRRYAGCSCTFRNPHRGLFLSAIAWEGHRPVYRRFGAIALPGHSLRLLDRTFRHGPQPVHPTGVLTRQHLTTRPARISPIRCCSLWHAARLIKPTAAPSEHPGVRDAATIDQNHRAIVTVPGATGRLAHSTTDRARPASESGNPPLNGDDRRCRTSRALDGRE
jgi:hypothetical protein